ncbi:MAG: transporter substrate-binding domain-containing protein [Alphaproteobacteria bacterium]
MNTKTILATSVAIALAISINALAISPHANAQQVVRMGTEGAYPPYNFINDAGEVDGFERELGDELCKRANLECVWVTNDWDSIIPNLVSGNYDTIIAGMSITPERDEVIDFTQEYYPSDPSIFVALTGAGPAAMHGVVAAQTGTIQAAYIASTDAQLLEFPTPDETLAAVRRGEADAVFADNGYLLPFVEESNGELAVIGDGVQIGGGVGLGIRESDDELKSAFDKHIADMKEDGSLNELIIKWFAEDGLTF